MGDRIAVLSDGILQQIDTPLALYTQPANIFVAGFIGSPSMNFFDSTLVREDGTLYLDAGDFRVRVPSDHQSAYQQYAGREVVFGIRPEHVHAPDFAPPNIQAAPVRGTVEVVELLGHELHLYMTSGKNSFVATVDTRAGVHVGNEIDLVADMGHMHLFDKETEQAIR
jgi:multiple sugar transport system ATP-binding protein